MEERIRSLWPDLDTQQIADKLGLPESVVYNVLFAHKPLKEAQEHFERTRPELRPVRHYACDVPIIWMKGSDTAA